MRVEAPWGYRKRETMEVLRLVKKSLGDGSLFAWTRRGARATVYSGALSERAHMGMFPSGYRRLVTA